MMDLFVAGGDASVILDVENQAAYCYGNQYAKIHEMYGGTEGYVSRSGLSRNGRIARDANILELGRYRVDAKYCTNPGEPIPVKDATVWALAPIANSEWLQKHWIDSDTFGGAWSVKPFVVVVQYGSIVALYFERKASDLVYRLNSLYSYTTDIEDRNKKVQIAYYDSNLTLHTLQVYVFNHELGCGLNYERFVAHIIKPQLEDCSVITEHLMMLNIEQYKGTYFQRNRFGVIDKVSNVNPLFASDAVIEEWTRHQLFYRTEQAVVVASARGTEADLFAYNSELKFAYMPASRYALLFNKQEVINNLLVKLEQEV
ncbi:hypothetical protein [Mahella australiensis]|uniref:Uncharacterized protein n=1 Tax=Mahella australiensis (strain DSM 15567 / CIP 107919 / 50-1 BON) TaxID=697281 RepID=F3ZXF9_MAHA5|nr:hypothetical protein [Mahella australiensis]AEE97640.1 hypothetical protein Mahau_2482 [Mahella australiensis 50-1 BON]